MRWPALASLVLAVAACGQRAHPYRFASPMLGTAELPPPPLPGAPAPERLALANRARREAPEIRVVSAPRIREASAAAAAAIAEAPAARPAARAELRAPHRLAASEPLPAVRPLPDPRAIDDLRALVGRRDKRDPVLAALAWAHDLGLSPEGATGDDVLAWAERTNRLDPDDGARPGDLLVFDQVASDARADLVAVVLGRDDRGVIEFLYVGGGVIRRGFVDPARPTLRRDRDDKVANTFLRHGKRWPAKGTRYLAGELLAHVVRVRPLR